MSHRPDNIEPNDYVNYGGGHRLAVPVDFLCSYPVLAGSLNGLYDGDSVYPLRLLSLEQDLPPCSSEELMVSVPSARHFAAPFIHPHE